MTKIRNFVTVTFILIWALSICAQINLNGSISDSEGDPLEAIVTVSEGSKIIAYTMADSSGKYSLNFSSSKDTLTIKYSLLGFETYKTNIPSFSQKVDVTLKPDPTLLKEFIVVADKITERGDTISYNVSGYLSSTDRYIGDVIKKMPGLDINENGRIRFNGKDVKNLYIEDMDLLQGRYGIATNNISANDVASVQIYQNHQSIRALTDIQPSEDITINLKLKSSSIGTWGASGSVGIGYRPVSWSTGLTAMYFGKKMQNLTIFKGNNTGKDLKGETQTFQEDGSLKFFNQAPLSVSKPISPGIAPRRYIKNRSFSATLNQLFKVDSLTSINFNFYYNNDSQKNEGLSEIQQYVPISGEYRIISQLIENNNYINSLIGAITVNKNAKGIFVKNAFRVKTDWNKDNASSTTSSNFTVSTNKVKQFLDNPMFEISDGITIIKNSGSRAWNITAKGGWNHRPQALHIGPYVDSLTTDWTNIQKYTTDDIKFNFFTSQIFSIKNLNINMDVFGDVDIENVKSELSGFNALDSISNSNNYLFGKIEAGIGPQLNYTLKDWHTRLTLYTSYMHQWLNDRLDNSRDKKWDYALFMPNLHMTYSLGRSWIILDAYYNRMINNAERAASGIVMTDYLSFRRSEIEKTLIDQTIHGSISYRFSRPLNQLFGNAQIAWFRFNQNYMSEYVYDGLFTASTVLPIPNVSNRFSLSANIDKGFNFWGTTAKFNCLASLYKGNVLIDDCTTHFRTQTLSASAIISMIPIKWMNASFTFAYGQSKSITKDQNASSPWIRNCSGRIDLNFSPTSNLIFNFSAENNYTNLSIKNKNTWFGDAKVIFKKGRFDYELAFSNIFNRKHFTKVVYTNMDIYSCIYKLRERNVMITVQMKFL